MSSTHSLEGRRIAITGAGRGIGLATAHALHERGARVAIGDIDLDAAKEAATEVGPDVPSTSAARSPAASWPCRT